MNIVLFKLEKMSVKENRWKVFLFFVLSVVLMENSWFGQSHLENTTNGLRMIDMNFHNSPDQIIQYLKDLGTNGRSAYQILLGLDYVLILSFGLLQCTLLLGLLRGINVGGKLKYIIMLPILRGLFDVIETTSMLINTSLYNVKIESLLRVASFSTTAKWVFLWATLFGIAILLIANIIQKIKGDN